MKTKTRQVRGFVGVVLSLTVVALLGFVGTVPRASAAINQQINFQGKLTNPDGTNVTNGTYSIRFRIYTDPTLDAANTCSANSCRWEETQAAVTVTDGIFQVALGSVNTALASSVDFNNSGLYLGIKIASDAEMTPRVRFTASPYALNSEKLNGISSTGFVQLGQSASAQADASTNSSIFINKTAAGNLLQLQSSGVDVFTLGSTGNITLGQNAAKTISVAQTSTNAAGQNLTVAAGQGGAGAAANAGGQLILQGGAGGGTNGAGGDLVLAGGAGSGTGATGTVVVRNSGNSADAFQVQDASSSPLLTVDTTARSSSGGNLIKIGNSTGTDTALTILQLDSATANPTTNLAALNGGMFYNSATNKISIIENGVVKEICNKTDLSCSAGGATSLQTAYTAGNAITTTAGNGVNVTAGAVPTADMVSISNAGQGVTTAGVSGLQINYVGGAAAVESSAARIDLTPGTTSGGIWNGLRIVANAVGPVTGVTQYGIKLEGPTGAAAGTDVAMRIDANWDAGLQMGGKTSDPGTPSTDNIYLFARKIAGRTMLRQKSPSGVAFAYQPALFEQAIAYVGPGAGSGVTQGANFTVFGSSWTGVATLSHLTSTEATGYVMNFATAATASSNSGIYQTNTQWIRGSTAGANGFFYVARIGTDPSGYGSGSTGARLFTGLTDQATNTMVNGDNPAGNYAGFQYSTNRADANWQFITKNGTTQNVVNTSMAMAANKMYDVYIYAAPQATTLFWRIDNLTDGTTQEGSTATNLPTSTTPMRAEAYVQTLTTTARNLRVAKIYVEADR